jgi:hypothetical protein
VIFKTLMHQFVFGNNRVEDKDITDVEFLRRVEIDFVGTLTAVGGTTDATLLEDGLLKTLLKRIEFKADGSDPFGDTHGQAEYWRRAILSGSPGVLVSTMPVGAAATAQRVHVVIDMDELASAAKFAGRIDTRRLASLTMRITNGNTETDMVTGGDRVETLAGTLSVYAVYDDGNSEAGVAGTLGYMGGGRRIAQARHTIVAANNRAELPIPADMYIGKILFIAVNNNLRVDTILTNLTVKIGEKEYLRADVSWANLQNENVEDYGLQLVAGAPPYAGLAILDFDLDRDMKPSKILNTMGLRANAAKVLLTVGAPTGVSYVDMIVYGVDPRGIGRQKNLRR